MREPCLFRWLGRLLPAWVRERVFEPSYHDMLLDAVAPTRRQAVALWLQCLLIWLAESLRRLRGRTSMATRRISLPSRRSGAPARSLPLRDRGNPMESLALDLRAAWRSAFSRPGFSALVVGILVLGIGASTVVFSLLDSLVLRPLPFRDPGQLVYVTEGRFTEDGAIEVSVTPADFHDWRDQARSFVQLAAYHNLGFNITGGEYAERIEGFTVSSNFFELLGVEAALGRTFAGDPDAGQRREAVISNSMWMQRYGGDPGVVGRAIALSESRHTIVGVAPAGFHFQANSDIWVAAERDVPPPPIDLEADYHDNRELGYFKAIGRLRPGVSIEQASDEMVAIHARIAEAYPEEQGDRTAMVGSLHEVVVGDLREPLAALFGAVAVVLLIACANVAGLLLARATTRQREVAIRAAIGASRTRIVRQLLAEALVLAGLGGALALAGSYAIVEVLPALLPIEVSRIDQVSIDLRVVGFGALMSLVTGVAFGCAPALQLARSHAGLALQSTRGEVRAGFAGARGALVVVEVALALVLVVGAGLMAKGLLTLTTVEPGFDPEGVVTARLVLPEDRYDDDEKIKGFYRSALEELRTLPGIEAAGMTLALPFTGSAARMGVYRADRPLGPDAEELRVVFHSIGGDYFRTMRVPLLRGRAFAATDRDGSPYVAVVNEAFVRAYLADLADPLSVQLSLGDEDRVEIVGVVGTVRHEGFAAVAEPEMYMPVEQIPWRFAAFVARTPGDPASMAESVRDAIRRVDPQQPIVDARPLTYFLQRSVAPMRFGTLLLVGFAGSALLLASLGLLGLVNYSVAQRTPEIGVRMALGAGRRSVLRLVLRQGLGLVGLGLLVGLAGGIALTRLVDIQVDGVSTLDPTVIFGAALVLGLVGAISILLPARRATRIDPMRALRGE